MQSLPKFSSKYIWIVLCSLSIAIVIDGLQRYRSAEADASTYLEEHLEAYYEHLKTSTHDEGRFQGLYQHSEIRTYRNDSLIAGKNLPLHERLNRKFVIQKSLNNSAGDSISCTTIIGDEKGKVLNSLLKEIDAPYYLSITPSDRRSVQGWTYIDALKLTPLRAHTSSAWRHLKNVLYLVGFGLLFYLILHRGLIPNIYLGVLAIFVIRILLATLGIYEHPLDTDNFLHRIGGIYSVPGLFLNGVIVVLIGSSFRSFIHTIPAQNFYRTLLQNVFFYFCITSFLSGVLYVLKHHIDLNSENIDINLLFNSGLTDIINLMSFILILLGVFFIQHRLYQNIYTSSPKYSHRIFAFGLAIIPSVLLVQYIQPEWTFIAIFIALLAYITFFDLFVESNRPSITWLIVWMLIYSCLMSISYFDLINTRNNAEIERELDKSIVNSDRAISDLLQKKSSDISSELLSALGTIPYPSKIIKQDFKAYIAPYIEDIASSFTEKEIEPYILDRYDNSIIEDQPWLFSRLKNRLSSSMKTSQDVSYDPVSHSYFIQKEIINDQHPGSPFVLFLELNDVDGSSVIKTQNNRHNLPTAVYNQSGILLYDSNGSFPKSIDPKVSSQKSFVNGKDRWFTKSNDKNIVIVRKQSLPELIKPISFFSYIFSLVGLIMFGITFVNKLFPFIPEEFKYKIGRTSLRNRIQISVITLIILSFLVIGLVTIYYFQKLSENSSRDGLVQKTSAILDDIQLDAVKQYEWDQALREIKDRLSRLSFTHKIDLSLYDKYGKFQASTLQLYGDLSSTTLESHQLESLSSTPGSIRFERMAGEGNQYNTTLAAINGPIGRDRTGVIQVFSDDENRANRDVNNFMGTLLNVYVFLFLIAGAIAIAVANSITHPISVLGDKLSKFKLGKRNEPLEWESKDELGDLIQEYNTMISKLDDSANLLAKTERDTAWREMAKQVAHEIKNPLTPMKLSIQYLERAVASNPEEAKKLIPRVSATLIEQIENLSQIAGEFSNFAKLPQGENHKVILNETVEAVHDLFRKRDDMDITLLEPIDDITVFADKNHLVRILNNLVKNAIQAIPTDRRGKISLKLYKDKDNAYIQVSDNGTGIPADMRDKVFTPNFTTKSSGTGLGLAIAANMIDSFGGRIYFDTEENVGTDFFVEIPLMRLKDNFSVKNRVSL